MYIITFMHEGRVYQRRFTRKKGFYVMESKGIEYFFAKDISKWTPLHGWHIINGGRTLPPEFMQPICDELEKIYIKNNPHN
jgi:hypothetical protein